MVRAPPIRLTPLRVRILIKVGSIPARRSMLSFSLAFLAVDIRMERSLTSTGTPHETLWVLLQIGRRQLAWPSQLTPDQQELTLSDRDRSNLLPQSSSRPIIWHTPPSIRNLSIWTMPVTHTKYRQREEKPMLNSNSASKALKRAALTTRDTMLEIRNKVI